MKLKRRQRTREEEDAILRFWGTKREDGIILMVMGAIGLGAAFLGALPEWALQLFAGILGATICLAALAVLITKAAAAIAILFFRWRERRENERERIKAVFVYNQDEED